MRRNEKSWKVPLSTWTALKWYMTCLLSCYNSGLWMWFENLSLWYLGHLSSRKCPKYPSGYSSRKMRKSCFFYLIWGNIRVKSGLCILDVFSSFTCMHTWHDPNVPISSQSTSWQLGVKSKCYEHDSCVGLGMVLAWGHVEFRKSSYHVHHMHNMRAMVSPRNMFGWDSYLDLEVIKLL